MNLKPALIGVITIIILGVLFGGRINRDEVAPSPQPPTHTPRGSVANYTTPAPNPHPKVTVEDQSLPEGIHNDEEPTSETPDQHGHDIHGPISDPQLSQAAIDTSRKFITGWLNPDPAQRLEQVTPVGGQGLVEQLATANLRTWNTQPHGSPEVLELLATTCMVRQRFTDGRAADLLLLAEPGAPHGWIVSDIQPAHTS